MHLRTQIQVVPLQVQDVAYARRGALSGVRAVHRDSGAVVLPLQLYLVPPAVRDECGRHADDAFATAQFESVLDYPVDDL